MGEAPCICLNIGKWSSRRSCHVVAPRVMSCLVYASASCWASALRSLQFRVCFHCQCKLLLISINTVNKIKADLRLRFLGLIVPMTCSLTAVDLLNRSCTSLSDPVLGSPRAQDSGACIRKFGSMPSLVHLHTRDHISASHSLKKDTCYSDSIKSTFKFEWPHLVLIEQSIITPSRPTPL